MDGRLQREGRGGREREREGGGEGGGEGGREGGREGEKEIKPRRIEGIFNTVIACYWFCYEKND
jgi:hypothetical protein